ASASAAPSPEHTIARLKDHQVLRQCLRKGEGVNHAVAGSCPAQPETGDQQLTTNRQLSTGKHA
ncbi:hypothetical protein ACH4S9_08050, partial [Streptomyces sp. NPDC021225]